MRLLIVYETKYRGATNPLINIPPFIIFKIFVLCVTTFILIT